MADRDLTEQERLRLQRMLKVRLDQMDDESTVTSELADEALSNLLKPLPGESLGDRIRRSSSGTTAARINADDSHAPPTAQSFVPLTKFLRMAASTANSETPLPPQGLWLESEDGRFRLQVTVENQDVIVSVEALGFATDEFANCHVGICEEYADSPITTLVLDTNGEGSVRVADTIALRRALLRPVIGLIQTVATR